MAKFGSVQTIDNFSNITKSGDQVAILTQSLVECLHDRLRTDRTSLATIAVTNDLKST